MQRFTEEWFNSVVEKLKTDAEFQEKGKGFDSSMHLRVLKDRKGKLNKDVAFGMWLPTCDPSWFGEKPIDEVDIVVEGKAGVLVDVFTGKKNVVVALSTGGLKLKKGSVSKLTGSLGAVNRFLEVIGLV
jgi:putative sterol carrier protein